jgi:cell division protease FtsH
MDWFWDKKDILFIWATNMIDLIDEAILRAWRFDRKILVDYPDFDTRKEIWKIYLSKSKTKTENKEVFDDFIDFYLLSEKTDGMVWADISEIVRRVKQNLANIYVLNKKKHILDSDKIWMISILEDIEKYKQENEFSMWKKKIGFDL